MRHHYRRCVRNIGLVKCKKKLSNLQKCDALAMLFILIDFDQHPAAQLHYTSKSKLWIISNTLCLDAYQRENQVRKHVDDCDEGGVSWLGWTGVTDRSGVWGRRGLSVVGSYNSLQCYFC